MSRYNTRSGGHERGRSFSHLYVERRLVYPQRDLKRFLETAERAFDGRVSFLPLGKIGLRLMDIAAIDSINTQLRAAGNNAQEVIASMQNVLSAVQDEAEFMVRDPRRPLRISHEGEVSLLLGSQRVKKRVLSGARQAIGRQAGERIGYEHRANVCLDALTSLAIGHVEGASSLDEWLDIRNDPNCFLDCSTVPPARISFGPMEIVQDTQTGNAKIEPNFDGNRLLASLRREAEEGVKQYA